jgi:uncharacterized protein
MKIYLDTCLVIYLLEGAPNLAQPVESAVLAQPEAQYCGSALLRMECLVGPLRSGNTALAAEYEQVFSALIMLPIAVTVYDHAARLRATHGLKTPDALHLATALAAGCDEFWTNDNRLSKVGTAIKFRVLP